MKPLKFKEVIELTAERTGQPQEVIAAVLRMYFKDIRTALTSLTYPQVQVMNLGTFCLKPNTMEKRLMRRYALLQRLSAEPGRHQVMLQEVSEEINQLESSLKMIRQERERKRLIKQMRRANYGGTNGSDRDMEEKKI